MDTRAACLSLCCFKHFDHTYHYTIIAAAATPAADEEGEAGWMDEWVFYTLKQSHCYT